MNDTTVVSLRHSDLSAEEAEILGLLETLCHGKHTAVSALLARATVLELDGKLLRLLCGPTSDPRQRRRGRYMNDRVYKFLVAMCSLTRTAQLPRSAYAYSVSRIKAGRGRSAPILWLVTRAESPSREEPAAAAPLPEPPSAPEVGTTADDLEARAKVLEESAAELRKLAAALRKSTRLYTAEDMGAALAAGERKVWAEIASRGRL